MIELLIVLVIAILILWAATTLLPLLNLPPKLQTVVYVLVVVVVVLWAIGRLYGRVVL